MKAAILHAPRDLRIEDRPDPQPGPNQVVVRIRAGGICGSDLHYYQHGGFGTVRLRQPMILGHEIAGEIAATGPGVQNLPPGTPVAVNPSLPCNACRFCLRGQQNHCLDMRFYGSAMRTPHVDGGFRELLLCEATQAVPLPPGLSIQMAAFAEPLAVCLHAVRQAGPLLGARVLVTGAGPIGMLAIMAARQAGAQEIVATDILDAPLALARKLGADHTINTADPTALDPYKAEKGQFDAALEASGNPRALTNAFETVRPGGTIVQIGIANTEMTLPINMLTAKELTLRGTFRFHEEFAWAVTALASGAIDPAPLLTEVVPLGEAVRAFDLAGDKSRAMKVQLAF